MTNSALPPKYDPTVAETTWYPIWEEAGYFRPEGSHIDEALAPYTIAIPPLM